MNTSITDITALEARVGRKPAAVDMKVLDHLDAHDRRWVAAAPFAFLAFGDRDGIAITAAGGAAGFAEVADARSLRIPRATLDDAATAREGSGFGSLFLIPGCGETLRVNGRVTAVDDAHIAVAVEECYLHCAKALIRSGFWDADPSTTAPDSPEALLGASRFMALATVDAQGRADVSPKGDPAGSLLRLQEGDVWYADRPGNRRTDSFRNILTQPRVAALALVPGTARVVALAGSASINADEAMRAAFTVAERTPKVVTRIAQPALAVRDSAALARAALWPASAGAADIDPATMFAAHVKHNKAGGVGAGITRAAVSVPGLMARGLKHDYKHNLY